MTTEATTTRHAKAILKNKALMVEFSKPTVVWFPGKNGKRIPRNMREDLFDGCFDAVALDDRLRLWLVQWTSANSGNVYTRKKKIEDRILPLLEGIPHGRLRNRLRIEVWFWNQRQGFSIIEFDFSRWTWKKKAILVRSPLLSAIFSSEKRAST